MIWIELLSHIMLIAGVIIACNALFIALSITIRSIVFGINNRRVEWDFTNCLHKLIIGIILIIYSQII